MPKRDPIALAGLEFKTKKALYEFSAKLYAGYRKQMTYNAEMIEILNKEHKAFTLELLKRHPDYAQKNGTGVTNIYITENFSGGTHMVLKRSDGTLESASWVQCCYQRVPNERAELIEAMRTAIVGQLFQFNVGDPCVRCGSTENLEIDHVDPFIFLVDEFLTGLQPPTKFTHNERLHRMEFCEEDVEFRAGWEDYHMEHAKLQILCRPCHIIKTAEERRKTPRA